MTTEPTADAAAQATVVVYRRDHCPFCFRLERGLQHAGVEYEARDIWADDGAADFVRSVNDGNETVPTVVVTHPDGQQTVRTNPGVAQVLADLGQVPEERPGLLGRLLGRGQD